jgi:hypothetical protein
MPETSLAPDSRAHPVHSDAIGKGPQLTLCHRPAVFAGSVGSRAGQKPPGEPEIANFCQFSGIK